MIKSIDFFEICKLWDYLHPGRDHIKFSRMMYLDGFSQIKDPKVFYFGFYESNKLIGVNSCHFSEPGKFRSRGLYVLEQHRNKGIGNKLLRHTIKYAFEHVNFIWSFPKHSALSVYEKAGFIKTSDFRKADFGVNCYVSMENK